MYLTTFLLNDAIIQNLSTAGFVLFFVKINEIKLRSFSIIFELFLLYNKAFYEY